MQLALRRTLVAERRFPFRQISRSCPTQRPPPLVAHDSRTIVATPPTNATTSQTGYPAIPKRKPASSPTRSQRHEEAGDVGGRGYTEQPDHHCPALIRSSLG